MAKARTRSAAKAEVVKKPEFTCRDCANSYDWNSVDWKGDMILCRCDHHEDGKNDKFLKDPQCEFFKKRQDNG